MSGIFGIVRLPGAHVSEAELASMADALKHRGPDGIRYKVWGNAGLGHCMLHSTPESLCEQLPRRDELTGLTITADARIDNRDRLLADIPMRSVSGQLVSDSELILRAYLKWGESCVDHLLGDFAFAIWDERAQALFFARDHMGCKPFYYHRRNGMFVFASSALAVARITDVKATLNEGRMADYLVQELEGINKTCTWFNEISRFPPAHCGRYLYERFQMRQYWVLEPLDLSHIKSDEGYLEAFTDLYAQAVRARLRCHTEPASMLSGGLDSSTVVALARDMLCADGKPALRTYSGISDDIETCPESRSIESILSMGDLRPTVLRPSDVDDYTCALNDAAEAMEDPFDTGWTMLALMFSAAAKDGGRVLLSGVDGELAVGLPANYIKYLLQRGKWLTGWNEARGFSRHYYRGDKSASAIYLKCLRARIVPDTVRKLRDKLLPSSLQGPPYSANMLTEDCAASVDLPARVLEYQKTLINDAGDSLQDWQKHIIRVPFLIAGIERYERLASYSAIETRHPLLDVRLLAFSVALPWQQKVRGGWSKFMLRRLANERLPASVAWREGWEQLGFEFAERRAGVFARDQGFAIDEMKDILAPYIRSKVWEQYQAGELDCDPSGFISLWQYHLLCHWLQNNYRVDSF